jgi:hypothetical protein
MIRIDPRPAADRMDRETIEALRDPGHRDDGTHRLRAKVYDPERFTCGWCATT